MASLFQQLYPATSAHPITQSTWMTKPLTTLLILCTFAGVISAAARLNGVGNAEDADKEEPVSRGRRGLKTAGKVAERHIGIFTGAAIGALTAYGAQKAFGASLPPAATSAIGAGLALTTFKLADHTVKRVLRKVHSHVARKTDKTLAEEHRRRKAIPRKTRNAAWLKKHTPAWFGRRLKEVGASQLPLVFGAMASGATAATVGGLLAGGSIGVLGTAAIAASAGLPAFGITRKVAIRVNRRVRARRNRRRKGLSKPTKRPLRERVHEWGQKHTPRKVATRAGHGLLRFGPAVLGAAASGVAGAAVSGALVTVGPIAAVAGAGIVGTTVFEVIKKSGDAIIGSIQKHRRHGSGSSNSTMPASGKDGDAEAANAMSGNTQPVALPGGPCCPACSGGGMNVCPIERGGGRASRASLSMSVEEGALPVPRPRAPAPRLSASAAPRPACVGCVSPGGGAAGAAAAAESAMAGSIAAEEAATGSFFSRAMRGIFK